MNCSLAKVNQVRELSDTLDENLRHAKALLDVALTGDFVSLDAHTQYDFLSVLDDKMNVAMQAHRTMVAACNTMGES